ncbi:MAG: transposase [Deltaproteobacteria bacterium]|nr:transposase [Deltaproteobacteria bacterium]
MEKIGIDVHKVASQVCIRTEDGACGERRIPTTREAFAKHLGGCARARILLEASTESEWVARCLEALGHEVIVADPNFAPMYATRSRKIKTDRRDARWVEIDGEMADPIRAARMTPGAHGSAAAASRGAGKR